MYILYIIVLKIKLITNLHALSVAIHVPPNSDIKAGLHYLPICSFDKLVGYVLFDRELHPCGIVLDKTEL